MDCLIHGVRRRLVGEADEGVLRIATNPDGLAQKGTIASILRIRDPHRPAETFRTVVTNDPSGLVDPAVVILTARDHTSSGAIAGRGSRSFLYWIVLMHEQGTAQRQ